MPRFSDLLIIDDDPAQVEKIQARLSELSLAYRCHYAASGEHALEFLHRRPPYDAAPRPHLILLSLHLPENNGDQVLRAIKSNSAFCAIPMIVISASRSLEDLDSQENLSRENAEAINTHDLDTGLTLLEEIERFWTNSMKLHS